MNLSKTLLLTFALSLSSAAFAEGGADRVFTRMMQAQQTTVDKKPESQTAASETKKAGNCKGCC